MKTIKLFVNEFGDVNESQLGSQLPVMASSAPAEQAEPEKGPHRGRMLRDGDFALELSIFERALPEFRVWLTKAGQPIDPKFADLNVKLTRLGNVVDDINFYVQGDFLRGDMEIYDPIFVVTIEAKYRVNPTAGNIQLLHVPIEQAVAKAMDIQTAIAGL